MYVNAGLKSKKELATRLMEGDVFYHKGSNGSKMKVHFDPSGRSPFRIDAYPLSSFWDMFEEFTEKQEWFNNIGDRVPCWVSNTDPTSRYCVDTIHTYKTSSDVPFCGYYEDWRYATPLKEDDLIGAL